MSLINSRKVSAGAVYFRQNCPYDVFAKNLPLGIAKELLGEFIEKGYFSVFVHAQNNTVGILYKLAVFIFAYMQHLLRYAQVLWLPLLIFSFDFSPFLPAFSVTHVRKLQENTKK